MMGHVISTVSKRLSGAVSCVRIDVDKYPALASKYQVQVIHDVARCCLMVVISTCFRLLRNDGCQAHLHAFSNDLTSCIGAPDSGAVQRRETYRQGGGAHATLEYELICLAVRMVSHAFL
jgi:hypothetical protein